MTQRRSLGPAARKGSTYALGVLAITACAWTARGCTAAAVPEEVQAAAARVEPGAAYAWLEAFQGAHPRRGTPATAASAAYVQSAFRALGLADVRIEALPFRGATLRNVLGRVPGRDGSCAVMLCAHHDAVPQAPGAIDDGGALAALLEAARVLLTGPPPPCDVVIASFDGEELGLLGAKEHLAAQDEAARGRLRAALAVELVGWREDDLVVHTIPHGFAWEAPGISPAWVPESVQTGGRELGLAIEVGDPLVSPFYQATIRVLGVGTGSDAGAFAERGIPSAMLTGSSLTNFYAGYHTPTDDLSRVDPARLDDAARAIVAAGLELGARASRGPHGAQGDAYLCLGPVTFDLAALIALACAAAGVAAIPAWDLRQGAPLLAAGLATLGLGTVAVTCSGSVLGALVTAPLAVTAGAAARLERGRRLLLGLGLVPGAIEVLLLIAAGSMFGFRWRGGVLETGLTLLLPAVYLLVGRGLLRGAETADGSSGPSGLRSAA
ncbi:MAG: M20/M25/M40 family metallo-hydrolase [Planctomycetota bacterium]